MDAMKEMVNEVVQKAEIAEHQAAKAVQAVMDYMMARIPEPMASQVKGHVMGGTTMAQGMGEMGKEMGGKMEDMSKGMGDMAKGMGDTMSKSG